MEKTLKCDFFQIEAARQSALPLDRLLTDLLALDSDSKNLEEFQTVFRMDPITGTRHRIYGDLGLCTNNRGLKASNPIYCAEKFFFVQGFLTKYFIALPRRFY
jgi:hypothetical protein